MNDAVPSPCREVQGAPWWNDSLRGEVRAYLYSILPREGFALFLKSEGGPVYLAPQAVFSTPTRFLLDPQAVVDLCYRLERDKVRVLGTVHSHPLARNRGFSDLDDPLFLWGHYHLLCIYDAQRDGWDDYWCTRATLQSNNDR